MRKLIVLLATLPFCMAQNEPRIRVNVNLINVSFTVRDTTGKLVPNLTKDDFEVFEDGAPQTIAFFARSEDVPLTLGLVIDDSGSQQPFVKKHEHDLETFLKSVLTPRDKAFVLCFANRLRLASDFTASPSQLIDGLKQFEHEPRGFPDVGPPEMRLLGTAFYDALYYATTDLLAPIEGNRKALIVMSDGEDNSSAHHMLDAIETAQSENVVIFGVRYTDVKNGRPNARNKYGTRVIERISRETGGSDFDAEKAELKKAFRAIGEELRTSYELAYHTTNPVNDGTFHKLVIRAKQPDITVRVKTGYYSRKQ